MTIKQIENRLNKLEQLEKEKKELEKQIDTIKDEIKEHMEKERLEELATTHFITRYITVVTNRFDSTRFKKEHKELYNDYTKQSAGKRFTYSEIA